MEFVIILSAVANVVLLGLLLRRRACRETPRPEAGHQPRDKENALLRQLADELGVFQNYYFLMADRRPDCHVDARAARTGAGEGDDGPEPPGARPHAGLLAPEPG